MLLPVEHLLRASLRAAGYRSVRIPTSAGNVHALDGRGVGPLPTVAMLHGLGSAGMHLAPVMSALRPWVRRIVAPDLLAHGYSDTPRGGVNESSLHTGLVESLDALLDEPAVVLGNSLGGLAAVRYALARPERVRALVLMSPGGAPLSAEEMSSLRRSFRLRSHREALAFVDRVFARPPRMRSVLAWGTRKKMEHPNVQAILDAIPSASTLSLEEVRGLPMPVMVLWGTGDRVLPETSAQWFREALPPHGSFVAPEGLGH
ncbi:MAG TPA: alpha/beta hydrolase, partial [Gemmatimonadaceae bacterium]|nr:alpha/beta hydrolase [Gemmatimonadaceae bacterium]